MGHQKSDMWLYNCKVGDASGGSYYYNGTSEIQNRTSEIRSVILCTTRSHKPMEGSYCTIGHPKSDMWLFHCKVTDAYGGFMLHNWTSEIRSVIVSLQSHTRLWGVILLQWDIRNPQ